MGITVKDINFSKLSEQADGLVPAIVQDPSTDRILMLGFMNEAAFEKTVESKKVTFFSRTRNVLWTKGETSGNFLELDSILLDCDKDTLLIYASPIGPTCHLGTDTCFNESNQGAFLECLQDIIKNRQSEKDGDSYTASLFKKGTPAIAQKVGEEAVELVIEAMKGDKERFKQEGADLLYHLLVLIVDQGLQLSDLVSVLKERNSNKA